MEAILKQINTVPGMIGSLVCDGHANVLTTAFPSGFDGQTLLNAAQKSLELIMGLDDPTGGTDLIDLRFRESRVLIRKLPKGFLFLLCTNTLNIQILNIYLNIAVNKLVTKFSEETRQQPVAAVETQPPATAMALKRSGKGIQLKVDTLAASAKISWDQMEESVAIDRELSKQLCEILKIATPKKLLLTNPANGRAKPIPVRIIDRDQSSKGDNSVVLTLAASEALEVKPGDEIRGEPHSGFGLFGR